MSQRPYRFALLAAAATALFVAGCEDEVTVDDGVPSEAEFLSVTRAATHVMAAGVNTNLGRAAVVGVDLTWLADVERRLGVLVPTSAYDASAFVEDVSALYDETTDQWVIEGTTTAGDSLDFDYSGRVAWFDGNGQPMRDLVFDPQDTTGASTTTARLVESVRLRFRAGDFETRPSYDVDLVIDLDVDILLDRTTATPRDTFLVDAVGSIVRRVQAPVDTSTVGVTGLALRGRLGPARSNNGCYTVPSASITDRMHLQWDRWFGRLTSTASGISIAWLDPEETITGKERIRFEALNLPLDCTP